MPTYEYKCEGECPNFEITQKIAEEPLKQCPICDNPVSRVIAPIGYIANCSGFHGKSSR